MEFPKFKLLQDFEIETEFAGVKSKQKIFEIGKEFSPNDDGIYIIEWFGGKLEFTLDQMRNAKNNELPLFSEQKTKYDLEIEEIDESNEELISNWRIQLDVKVSRKKVKEIENLIRKNVIPYI